MAVDIKIMSDNVNSSVKAAQSYIQACLQAVECKNKEDYKAYALALKNEVDKLASYLDPLLQQVKIKSVNPV